MVCFLHFTVVMASKLSRVACPAAVLLLSVLTACQAPGGDDHRPLRVRDVEATPANSRALALPNATASVKFAVIGDSGRGSRQQRELAEEMTRVHQIFPFRFVVMLGDNLYEGEASADDYRRKFEQPYAELLDADVDFYAVLGNHDDAREVNYEAFHMNGHRYYTFKPPSSVLSKIANSVEFFALDTTNPDQAQLGWLDEQLRKSDAEWKIALTHHPLYTSGRYRNTAMIYRLLLEPLLLQHGVDVVFSGHEHIYQRTRLQRGIQYFVSGGGGSVRPGEGRASSLVARTYADDLHFMLVEIDDDAFHFQAISRTGMSIDAGVIEKVPLDVRPSSRAARR